jgi:hypothetical protein
VGEKEAVDGTEPANQQVFVFGAVIFDLGDTSAPFSRRLRGKQ